MGNNNTKYDAPSGDGPGFKLVCSYDTLSRIRINYVERSNFNGFTICIPGKDTKTNWKNFSTCNVNEFVQLLTAYSRKYVTIFKDIFKDKNNTNVIQDIKFNENDKYYEYQVIFGSTINQIDINWHEKVYTAFTKYPLVCDSEKITINTNIHEPSITEKQLTQLYSGMIRICGSRRKKNFNPFEETIQMKVQRNFRLTTQIINRTKILAQHLQHLKTTKIVNVKQASKHENNLISVKKISNKNIQNVDDAISRCNVMIGQLKQNMATAVNQNQNIIENVSLQELENECERIDKIIQERYNEINKTTCELVINNIEFIQDQAQKMIEHDWKEYNTSIFKQWVLQMMEQFFDNGELNKSLNLQNILLIAKESIAIGAGFNSILAFCFLFCENETDAEFQLKLIDCRLNEIPVTSILKSWNVTINELLLTEKLFCNIIFDDNG